MLTNKLGFLGVLAGLAFFEVPSWAQAPPKNYRLPSIELKEPVIWGASGTGPDGTALAFGGQDQKADDGMAHTRIKVAGEWKAIHEDLRKNNPLQKYHDRCRLLAREQRNWLASIRGLYLDGWTAEEEATRKQDILLPKYEAHLKALAAFESDLGKAREGLPAYETGQLDSARTDWQTVARLTESVRDGLKSDKALATLVGPLEQVAIHLERVADALGAEPPPRALSPIVYDAKSKLYILFGGDHLDYLLNDTWVFDPATNRWHQRHPKNAPPPRANHILTADGEGRVRLANGYTYTSDTGYVSGQYRDIGDGEWVYSVADDTWTGKHAETRPNERVYRTGPMHPDFFLQGDRPDAAAFQKRLQDLPANTWVATTPPHLPVLNRDWGTAILDPDRDVILRWSGGHSAHGGTDVLHYHLASNRWELPFPVEFPLGQLYSNTSYPEGVSFNARAWITGHTYQSYGYDPILKKMLFTGQPTHCYLWDAEIADWAGRFAKPKEMAYNSCFYTLTLTPTPQGLHCWTQDGRIYRFDAARKEWLTVETNGEKLPGSMVDNSTVVHDAKRDRLLFFRKGYGDKVKFDGQIYALDLKSGRVSSLNPKGMAAAAAIPYLCQIRYDVAHDLLLVGGTLPPDEAKVRRTPYYDCAKNEWASFHLTGDDPSGKEGRNVSLGLMYDARRQRFWAVDTHGHVFVLRLDPATADAQPLP